MEVAATTPAECPAERLSHPVGLASFPCRLGPTLRERAPIQSANAAAADAITQARPPESAAHAATSASDIEIAAKSPASAYRCILVTQCHMQGRATLPTQPRGVAQLVAHRSPKPGVAGSSPVAPVRRNPRGYGGFGVSAGVAGGSPLVVRPAVRAILVGAIAVAVSRLGRANRRSPPPRAAPPCLGPRRPRRRRRAQGGRVRRLRRGRAAAASAKYHSTLRRRAEESPSPQAAPPPWRARCRSVGSPRRCTLRSARSERRWLRRPE